MRKARKAGQGWKRDEVLYLAVLCTLYLNAGMYPEVPQRSQFRLFLAPVLGALDPCRGSFARVRPVGPVHIPSTPAPCSSSVISDAPPPHRLVRRVVQLPVQRVQRVQTVQREGAEVQRCGAEAQKAQKVQTVQTGVPARQVLQGVAAPHQVRGVQAAPPQGKSRSEAGGKVPAFPGR